MTGFGRPLGLALGLGVLAGLAAAAPRSSGPRLDPGMTSDVPTAVVRVRPAVVGLRAWVAPDRPSASTLGQERWGTGVLIEPDGLVLTVGYLVLEAERLEGVLADGRTVSARVVGHDFESGFGLVRLAGGPYPAARVGSASALTPGQPVSIVGRDEHHGPTALAGRVTRTGPFVAYWEYMLERALFVAPLHPAFGGAAVVDPDGALVGLVSLRLAEDHLAIPVDLLGPVRDALLARGRPGRPPRPWLGLRAVTTDGGVGVAGVSPAGPAAAAGLRHGDVVVRLGGARLADLEDFYRKLWATAAGSQIELTVLREGRLERLTVRSRDRYEVYRFRSP